MNIQPNNIFSNEESSKHPFRAGVRTISYVNESLLRQITTKAHREEKRKKLGIPLDERGLDLIQLPLDGEGKGAFVDNGMRGKLKRPTEFDGPKTMEFHLVKKRKRNRFSSTAAAGKESVQRSSSRNQTMKGMESRKIEPAVVSKQSVNRKKESTSQYRKSVGINSQKMNRIRQENTIQEQRFAKSMRRLSLGTTKRNKSERSTLRRKSTIGVSRKSSDRPEKSTQVLKRTPRIRYNPRFSMKTENETFRATNRLSPTREESPFRRPQNTQHVHEKVYKSPEANRTLGLKPTKTPQQVKVFKVTKKKVVKQPLVLPPSESIQSSSTTTESVPEKKMLKSRIKIIGRERITGR